MRVELARRAEEFPTAMPAPLQRSAADTLVAEVLPVLDACRFLERNAAALLAPRALEDGGHSVWLGDVTSEIHRDPAGVVLIIAPANYPLVLAGVQCLQALIAGNAVLWKPAPGTSAVAQLFADCWSRVAGSASGTLRILDETDATATEAIHAGVDRVLLTGSAATGEVVMRELAKTGTSSVMELSGCDSVFVLEGADVPRVVEALAFGMRFNGSATCMAPRRLFVTDTVANELIPKLSAAFARLGSVKATESARQLLKSLVKDAEACGAQILLDGDRGGPTLIDHATPDMRVMQADIFAPVLAIMRVASVQDALDADAQCPYALTAAIFGPELEARALALRINAGTVFINDVITPSADPRAPFGGRKASGFGVTRGAEGLLAMTNVKAVMTQRSRSRRRYQPTTAAHAELFGAYIAFRHAAGITRRLAALPRLLRAGLTMNKKGR
jgi:acyl-CoA reductase-like NAD-dependent aldehyde dehydrogenase